MSDSSMMEVTRTLPPQQFSQSSIKILYQYHQEIVKSVLYLSGAKSVKQNKEVSEILRTDPKLPQYYKIRQHLFKIKNTAFKTCRNES